VRGFLVASAGPSNTGEQPDGTNMTSDCHDYLFVWLAILILKLICGPSIDNDISRDDEGVHEVEDFTSARAIAASASERTPPGARGNPFGGCSACFGGKSRVLGKNEDIILIYSTDSRPIVRRVSPELYFWRKTSSAKYF
jgi:hypothetical protein